MPVPPLDAFMNAEVKQSTSADGITHWSWDLDYWTHITVSIRGDEILLHRIILSALAS